jgi:putative transcriptional regulator
VPSFETPERLVLRVARRIAELRREAGLTQAQLAERLDVSVQYISKIEQGENLGLRALAEIARALETNVNSLFLPPSAVPTKGGRGRPRRAP